ncbi:GNAT family N-acetyltransferase [Kineosporia sp. J2-2]|uniref:GNAT family N-acetyltransferase n=1 Tax=Kineosporia corallincola TaxID=2835133 RepID=A0ABS5TQT7_9ACTN|nr:GNAT family N-acetyltransferase [Kineosporia corallincola]MBT0772781.1 GNAT family N-acetyltransferase [Kineosporia corallincola]
MTDLLDWRPFEKSDRPALARFVCTDPESKIWDGSKKTHPRPWEYTVQSAVRRHRPRAAHGDQMYLGLDDRGIGAVVAWSRYPDPGQWLLQLIAVTTRYRGRGRGWGWAREAVQVSMNAMTEAAAAAGSGRLLVQARIDRRNTASKRLFGEAGFSYESDHSDDLETWVSYTSLRAATRPASRPHM